MLRQARDSLSLVRCAFTGVVYQPLVKRATQRNSRRRALCYEQPPSQYSAQRMIPNIRWIMCILHKNKRQKLRNSVQNFIEIGFFGFRPQYIVDFDPFYPIKSPASCVFTQFAFGSNPCYHMLENKGKGAATGGAARPASPPPRRAARPEPACTLPSKQRPVKAAHLHSKLTAPMTAGGSYKPAQHSAHTTAQFIASAFQNRRWRTRAKLKGRYWCTLKSKHRTVRIQLHRRVTVVLPAPTV